ncbi:MAG: transcriptional regulator [Opitutae bacterium]|nr:transcriptional regulator [Opitutae bacterium]
MQNIYSDERLRLAARLYYVDGFGQNEVAKFTKVSQAKVSRLLALARERGIVRITVADYDPRHKELEARMLERFGLKQVVVIKAIEGLAAADLRRAVGHLAAPIVDGWIQSRDIVALAGGRTIHELVRQMPELRSKSLTIVQAMGSVDSNVNAFDAPEVGRIMAQRLGGTFLAFNTPAYIPEKQARNALLKLEQVRGVQEQLSRAQMALVGVGTLENSVFVERGALQPADVAALRQAGAVGEICGRFFNEVGEECDTMWKDSVMSITLDQLRSIPQVVGVVSGSDRAGALRAAIAGNLLKSLVIDEGGAEALLASAGVEPPQKPKPKKKTK